MSGELLTEYFQRHACLGLDLRQQAETDGGLLRALFVARRAAEFAAAPWSDAQREAFLHAQADLQGRHYAQHYPMAHFLIIEQAGQAIGRLCLNESETDMRVVDIALLPAWQGLGIGSAVLDAVLTLCDGLCKACTLSVDLTNPAQALYLRLGFEVCADQGLYLQMRRQPSTAHP